MNKAISSAVSNENISRVLKFLEAAPAKLELLGKKTVKRELHTPLKKGERSFIETLAHIIHCEARSSEAIYMALMKKDPLFINIHPERDWGNLLRFDLLSLDELLAYFKIRRKILLRILSGLDQKGWERCIRKEGKQRKESVYWRARTIALHELEHLEYLEKMIK